MSARPFDDAIHDQLEGWRHYMDTPPPLNWLHIEIWRREWPGSQIVAQAQMHPEMNVAGLYWRKV